MMPEIHIILAEKTPHAPIFVEIETPSGKSIDIGTRHIDEEGYTHLVIDEDDICGHPLL